MTEDDKQCPLTASYTGRRKNASVIKYYSFAGLQFKIAVITGFENTRAAMGKIALLALPCANFGGHLRQ